MAAGVGFVGGRRGMHPRHGKAGGNYARRQGDRVFYRYDRRDRTLGRLGTAAELGRTK